MSLRASLVLVGKQYLDCFRSAFTDFRYPSRSEPNPRRKIATGRTLNSLRYETKFTGVDGAQIQIFADERYDRIIEGQAPRSYFPGSGSGSSFRLDSGLREWRDAVGYRGSDYRLALGIFIRGIAPANITAKALELADQKALDEQIASLHAEDVRIRIIEGFNAINKT